MILLRDILVNVSSMLWLCCFGTANRYAISKSNVNCGTSCKRRCPIGSGLSAPTNVCGQVMVDAPIQLREEETPVKMFWPMSSEEMSLPQNEIHAWAVSLDSDIHSNADDVL